MNEHVLFNFEKLVLMSKIGLEEYQEDLKSYER